MKINELRGTVINSGTILMKRGGKIQCRHNFPIGTEVCLLVNNDNKITEILDANKADEIVFNATDPIMSRVLTILL
jgi:hypothetical protein